jgi:hypothetical protein
MVVLVAGGFSEGHAILHLVWAAFAQILQCDHNPESAPGQDYTAPSRNLSFTCPLAPWPPHFHKVRRLTPLPPLLFPLFLVLNVSHEAQSLLPGEAEGFFTVWPVGSQPTLFSH